MSMPLGFFVFFFFFILHCGVFGWGGPCCFCAHFTADLVKSPTKHIIQAECFRNSSHHSPQFNKILWEILASSIWYCHVAVVTEQLFRIVHLHSGHLSDFFRPKWLTVIHTLTAMAAMQGADQHIRSSLGFSILPKDTSTRRPGEWN